MADRDDATTLLDAFETYSPTPADDRQTKIGVVTAGNGLTCRILFDGEQVVGGKWYPCMASYLPHVGDRVIVVPVGSATSWLVIGAIGNTYSPSMVMAGPGIDPTGTTDSTSGVRAFFATVPAGMTVTIPSGAVFNLSDTIFITKPMTVTGGGELRWVSGIGAGPGSGDKQLLYVNTSDVRLIGLHLTNPNRLFGDTGGKSSGIYINGSNVTVHRCWIDGQQNAILVDADGEWHDHIITDNFVTNVPGGGAEDRGDGITVMGAAAIVTGNRVHAAGGADCRIGIATEGLAVYEQTYYPYRDSMIVVANNVVTGPFRRSITSEGTSSCQIVGNNVSGFTVWGINVVNISSHNIIANNTVTSDIAAEEHRGDDLSPIRCGILAYDNVDSVQIHDNTIRVTGSATIHGIVVQQGTSRSTDVNIHHNVVDGLGGVKIGYGVFIPTGATRARVTDNQIKNFAVAGVYALAAPNVVISRNRITGTGSTTVGVHTEGQGDNGRFDSNDIATCGKGIEAYFRNGFVSISNNVILAAATGVDLYGFAGPGKLLMMGNIVDATTQFTNIPGSGNGLTVVSVGNV